MKAIMISIKPKWCAKIMNGEKTIEVRKNKTLANAIKKLISENGYADIYVYCSKGKERLVNLIDDSFYCGASTRLNGKVLFKFRCYFAEKILNYGLARRSEIMMGGLLKKSCLTLQELNKYAPHKEYEDDYIYAIHISDLEIFDKPKEIGEFRRWVPNKECKKCSYKKYYDHNPCLEIETISKAPQNFCYIEGEK